MIFKIKKQLGGGGMTLIEIIIVLGISGILGTVIYQFVTQGNMIFTQSRDQALAQDNLRKVTVKISKELREAQAADNGAYPLAQAATQSITFYSDTDNDGNRERLRYFLNGTNFTRGITEPIGLQYPAGGETLSVIATDIRNTGPIFTYYDENFTGTQAPLSQPININQVHLVHMYFVSDTNPLKPPDAISVETSVNIRNLKTNL